MNAVLRREKKRFMMEKQKTKDLACAHQSLNRIV